LGQLTDEVTSKYGEGASISQFVSLGPKSYSIVYEIPQGEGQPSRFEEITKFKGIRRSLQNAQLLSFSQMEKLLKRETSHLDIKVPFQVRRNRGESLVFNIPTSKQITFRYDKRYLLKDFTTLPYGFRRNGFPTEIPDI
jgi:hypothetical protein